MCFQTETTLSNIVGKKHPDVYCMAIFWLKGVVGGKLPVCFLFGCKLPGGSWTTMGLYHWKNHAHGELFSGTDLVDISEVPSASVTSSVAARVLEIPIGVQGTGSKVDFGHVVGAACDSLVSERAEPIWNSGFWRNFGTDSLGDALSQQFKRPLPVPVLENEEILEFDKHQITAVIISVDGPLFHSCDKSTDDIAWQEQRDALLQKVLKCWSVLALSWCDSVDFVVCLKGCNSTNVQLTMLGDVYRGKASNTLNKRAGSKKLLCQMLSEKNLVFPCKETQPYGVLCEFRSGGVPTSRGKGFLETVAFVRYTLDVTECYELLRGKRCWGATTSEAPLLRTQVLTGHHKTMRAIQRHHQFLPLIEPAVGITGKNWAVLLEKVPADMDLNMLKGQTLMPAPLGNGKLGLMALDSQEVSADSRGHVEEVHSRQFRSDCTRSGRLVNVRRHLYPKCKH